MPEILTKHPDIVKSILTKMGAQCGVGASQKILKNCPTSSFCSVPNIGEFCVLGTNELDKLTQFNVKEDFESGGGSRWWIWILVSIAIILCISLILYLYLR